MPRRPPYISLLGEMVGASTGAALGLLAAARGGKAVHPDGVVYEGRLIVAGSSDAPAGATLLSTPGEHRAIVRFFRSLGLPRPLPDLFGISIRVAHAYGRDRHQDLLLVTSADMPVVHHVFLPATDLQQRPYSSSLPYEAGGERFIVGALPDPRSPRPPGPDEFARIDSAARTGRLRFQIAVAAPEGRFQPVADLQIGKRQPADLDALRFNPWNSGGGMRPVGVLNGARDRAYKLSQGAWRRRRSDGAAEQDGADAAQALLFPPLTERHLQQG